MRRLRRGDGAQAQLAHEPILQRGPEPLDAALGLRRPGRHIADAKVLQHAAHVRGRLGAGQLFLDGPMPIITHEQIEPIAIHGERQAVRREQGLKQRGIAMDVIGGPELQGGDLARRIVDRAQQRQLGAPVLEPAERAAVDLHQGPARGRLPELLPQSAHRFAADRELVHLAKLLGQVRVVEPALTRRHQGQHPVADVGRHAPR
jgi:hypothetical protein